MSEQYRRPVGVLLIAVLLGVVYWIGGLNDDGAEAGDVRNFLGLAAFLLALGSVLWFAALLLRKRD